ncbi:bifunctional UDP-N-acetylglucosamine diphosphorylase/glucosamine-1-phosphate N-acetyltransferase GlmU [soil metagenome]
MAAGEGTRMRSETPKVLHHVCGRAMIDWPIIAAREAGASRVVVIVSPNRTLESPALGDAEAVVQPEADGTGGAMRAAIEQIREAEEVVVLSGDHPLIDAPMIEGLLDAHRSAGAAATVMTVEMDDPGAYGRIVRDDSGGVERIVETKHPDSVPGDILAIREVNTGTYCFAGPAFADALGQIKNENGAGEYYLGDVLPILRSGGGRIAAHMAPDPDVNLGVNNRADLALAESAARLKILRRHMEAGVTVRDPATTWIEATVEIEPDAVIEPGSYLRGDTRVGAGATIGPHTTIADSTVGAGSTILRSHLDHARVGESCSVGPFAYLRPDADLADGVKAGTFVEVKNSTIGEGAKVPHLAYIGDADVGDRANVGAGTITANYDGRSKHRTKIGQRARIAVNNSLVAPVEIGDGAYTGAGAVIRGDVPPGALGVSDVKQRNIESSQQHSEKGDGE